MAGKTKNLEKCFEESQETGTLSIPHRNMKDFPRAVESFDLTDVVRAGKLKFLYVCCKIIFIFNVIFLPGDLFFRENIVQFLPSPLPQWSLAIVRCSACISA